MDLDEIIPFPRPATDLTDKFFGYLTVLGYLGTEKQGHWWLCFCTECLRTVKVRQGHLTAGKQKSCGRRGCKRLVRRLNKENLMKQQAKG